MNSRQRSQRIALVASCFVAVMPTLVLLGCFQPNPIEGEASKLIAMTSPPSSVIVHRVDPNSDEGSATASWTFLWHRDRKSYPEWVKKNILGDYTILDEQSNRLVFRRIADGVAFRLTIDPIDSVSQTLVTLIEEPL